jgi:gluconate 2-dehydrogenase gamma chain
MTTKDHTPQLGRRDFLKVVSVAGVASALPASTSLAEDMKMAAATPAPANADAPAAAPNAGFVFFNPDEAAAVTAIVDTLIPSDATGPGAVEAGVVTFIDRQLGGAFGGGARLYLEGPYAEGTPSQGYQLPYNPADLIRAGLADLAAYATKSKGKAFDALEAADRDAILKEMDGGKAAFATVPAKVVFDHIYNLVQEGYFGDPIYGGNNGKSVWKMIGFPGVAGMYTELITEYRNKPYPVDPQSIQDFA